MLDFAVDGPTTARCAAGAGAPEHGRFVAVKVTAKSVDDLKASDVSALTGDSIDRVYGQLADVGLAVAPGADFGPVDSDRFIRMSFAGSEVDIREALRRLGRWSA